MQNILELKKRKIKNRLPKSKGEQAVFAIVLVLFSLYAVGLMLPVFYGFMISLMENGRAYIENPIKFPWPMYFSNYILAFSELSVQNNSFMKMFFNSVWYAGGSSFVSLLSPTCVAYVVSKYKFRGRHFLYSMIIAVQMLPIYGTLPAQYKLYSQLGFIDSPLLLIANLSGFNATFLYIHAFFEGISWEIAEAGFIDGASNFKVFLKIMVPLVLPAVSILFVNAFISAWNNYQTPLLFLPNNYTLAAGIYAYERKIQYYANQPVYFAGAFISLLPILIIFICLQESIMTRVHIGALKG